MLILLYPLIIFLSLVYIYSIYNKYKEKFVSDFDKVLDFKCTSIDETTNNYLGPWDGNNNGLCGTYTCPSETCSYLDVDNSVNTFGTPFYKWRTENIEQKTVTDADLNVSCVSSHGTQHPMKAGITLNCLEPRVNDENHNARENCYEYDYDDNEWKKKKYIKLLGSDGNYVWRQIGSLNVTKREDEVLNCKKEPVDCSQSNQYCCEFPGAPDPCTKFQSGEHRRPINIDDQEIVYFIDKNVDDTGNTCATIDTCGIDCINDDNVDRNKNCWKYDASTREWQNDVFSRTFKDGVCKYLNNDETLFHNSYYETGVCQEARPEFTINSCKKDLKPITCGFLDESNNYFTRTYEPNLNKSGDRCVYETASKDDVLEWGSYLRKGSENGYYPENLPEYNPLCPLLSPSSCSEPEHYLEVNESGAPTCKPCPAGFYFEENKAVDNDDYYTALKWCKPIVRCDTTSECKIKGDCTTCLKRITSDGTIFENIYLDMIPNKDVCEPDPKYKDICEFNEDGSYLECGSLIITNNNEVNNIAFCDLCPEGKKVHFSDDGSVTCKRVYDCSQNANFQLTCLDTNTVSSGEGGIFKRFRRENLDDEFTPCVWKEVMGTNIINECRTTCGKGFYRISRGSPNGVGDVCDSERNPLSPL